MEKINHPKHYNLHPSNVECIDIIECYSFNVGSALKYLWRAGLKPGESALEDLRKAVWYVQREVDRLSRTQEHVNRPTRTPNGLDPHAPTCPPTDVP